MVLANAKRDFNNIKNVFGFSLLLRMSPFVSFFLLAVSGALLTHPGEKRRKPETENAIRVRVKNILTPIKLQQHHAQHQAIIHLCEPPPYIDDTGRHHQRRTEKNGKKDGEKRRQAYQSETPVTNMRRIQTETNGYQRRRPGPVPETD